MSLHPGHPTTVKEACLRCSFVSSQYLSIHELYHKCNLRYLFKVFIAPSYSRV